MRAVRVLSRWDNALGLLPELGARLRSCALFGVIKERAAGVIAARLGPSSGEEPKGFFGGIGVNFTSVFTPGTVNALPPFKTGTTVLGVIPLFTDAFFKWNTVVKC